MCTVTLQYDQRSALARRKMAALMASGLFTQIAMEPQQPTEEEITNLTKGVIFAFESKNGRKVEMRDMKTILAEVQKTYPSANGKVVSGVVKSSM